MKKYRLRFMHFCDVGYSTDFACTIAMHVQTVITSFGNSRCDLCFYEEIHLFEEKKKKQPKTNQSYMQYHLWSVFCYSFQHSFIFLILYKKLNLSDVRTYNALLLFSTEIWINQNLFHCPIPNMCNVYFQIRDHTTALALL